jgi:hypothetical protein
VIGRVRELLVLGRWVRLGNTDDLATGKCRRCLLVLRLGLGLGGMAWGWGKSRTESRTTLTWCIWWRGEQRKSPSGNEDVDVRLSDKCRAGQSRYRVGNAIDRALGDIFRRTGGLSRACTVVGDTKTKNAHLGGAFTRNQSVTHGRSRRNWSVLESLQGW